MIQHHAKLLPCHRTVHHQIPTLVSLENPVPQCPVHRILCPVRGSVVQRRVDKQLRDLFRQIPQSAVEPVTRTGLVCKPSVDSAHHLVRFWIVAERFLLVPKPEQLYLDKFLLRYEIAKGVRRPAEINERLVLLCSVFLLFLRSSISSCYFGKCPVIEIGLKRGPFVEGGFSPIITASLT